MSGQAQLFGVFSGIPVTLGASCFLAPTSRGPLSVGGGTAVASQRLPTDSIGMFVLTLDGLVVGSAIQVETQAGVTVEHRAAGATSEVFNVPAYSAGSASNSLRIKVRKGSSEPFYRPYETLAVASVGNQSIFVSQTLDQ